MKELSIEEKAKRYDEAIERAKKVLLDCTPEEQKVVEYISPELKESEDDRIRKDLIIYLRSILSNKKYGDKFIESWIAWLEKQGEQESVVVIPKFRVGDVIRPKGSMAEYTIESISGECYHGKGWGLNISSDDDYELVEQKSSWNKEDENMLQSVLWHVSNSVSNGKSQDFRCDLTEWLKSIKDRVQPQPKQEWSEEDEEQFSFCCAAIELSNYSSEEYRNYAISFLESLKERVQPQPQWKPSDEQIYSLDIALRFYGKGTAVYDSVKELLEQLKKLKE